MNKIIYTSKEYDITIIEVNNLDYIYNVSYLELDNIFDEIFEKENNEFSVYYPHYSHLNKKIYVSYGRADFMEEKEKLRIYIETERSSSSPILNLKSNKVVGIMIAKSCNFNFRIGTFLKYPIIELNKNINLIKKFKDYKEKDFEKLEFLSEGSYGNIYSAYSIKDKKNLCLKRIDLEKMKINYYENNIKDCQNDLNNEIKILNFLSSNKNSIKYYGSYTTDNILTLVLEKCDKNLKEFIKDRGCSLNVKEIKEKFKELNNLFIYMQTEEIIHKDLKLENLLVKYNNKEKTDYIIKVSDYGVSKFNSISKNSFRGFKGTIDTIAPEIILEKTKYYENSIDIFSLGIILYQISHNLKHPFGYCNTMSDLQYFDFIKKYQENYENDNMEIEFDKSIENKDFIDLVKKMIKLNPKNRLKWHEYFSHPFFK